MYVGPLFGLCVRPVYFCTILHVLYGTSVYAMCVSPTFFSYVMHLFALCARPLRIVCVAYLYVVHARCLYVVYAVALYFLKVRLLCACNIMPVYEMNIDGLYVLCVKISYFYARTLLVLFPSMSCVLRRVRHLHVFDLMPLDVFHVSPIKWF